MLLLGIYTDMLQTDRLQEDYCTVLEYRMESYRWDLLTIVWEFSFSSDVLINRRVMWISISFAPSDKDFWTPGIPWSSNNC